ncbi:conserved hypothetical protein [Ricinus communis]|uniref:Uncharacterized protein n=1 Tax=Ricinus communis TaxID=3988 RepID=B9S9K9_RICCO|nr:conserved hypothetical protein [Ricinus communis]
MGKRQRKELGYIFIKGGTSPFPWRSHNVGKQGKQGHVIGGCESLFARWTAWCLKNQLNFQGGARLFLIKLETGQAGGSWN